MTTSPDVLPTPVQAIVSAQARRRPVTMITSDADGCPRACLPADGDLRVIDDQHLRVALWPTSPTAVNLERGAPVLLIATAPPDVHLVHATARRLVNAAMIWAHYELTVTSSQIADHGTAPQAQPAQFSNTTSTRGEVLEM
ncbi:hypothetical protein [Actinomadura rubrisoli]|uniref:Pyridoxamine 5'-phosphate oxidase family protein n=1 Tax=Actinomadura rubrisoli TaxID=2530368 RepID=A0A4R5C4K0_9ACTN|nr:hypothetical protein [Actinomadura rubrisoli]TDD91834.1 hypothetical protein E1298_11330 [Actinomadura rubrisoli]